MSHKHIRGAPASKMPPDIKHACGSRQQCPACIWLASWRIESVRWRVYPGDEPCSRVTFSFRDQARRYLKQIGGSRINRVVRYTRRKPR